MAVPNIRQDDVHSFDIWFKLARTFILLGALFRITLIAMSVSFETFTLESGEGIYMEAGDDSGETSEKLIMNIDMETVNGPDFITRFCDFLNYNDCHAGKIYVGRNLDVLLIVYLDTILNEMMTVAANLERAFPEAQQFCPLNSFDDQDGLIWVGDSYMADAPAYCIF